MKTLYKDSWTHFKNNITLMLILAALLECAEFAKVYWSISGSALMVAQLIIVLFFHQIVLFGENLPLFSKPTRKPPVGHFIWASVMILIGAVGLAALVLTLTDLPRQQSIGVFLIAFFVAYFLLLVFFGTSLPAAVAKDRYNPKVSLGRAGKTWKVIAGNLLVGPVVLGTVLIGGTIGLGVTTGLIVADYTQLGAVKVHQILYGYALHIYGLFISMMAVVTLCRAYLRVAPPEILAEINTARETVVQTAA